ncbi:MAG: DUF2007 domain-containing protein [bacterium]|jgi:hypothetical protein|nr:MAG: hypothetical protein DIU52_05170 [bacterium]
MSDWVKLRNYASRAEADFHAGLLRGEGIPVLLQGPDIGIFGGGFGGMSVQGVTLLVPAADLDHALEVLGLDEPEDEPA